MGTSVAEGTLQAATTIAKTTQTGIGAATSVDEIGCVGYDYITLFFDYVNGDETGLIIRAHFLQASGGTEYQDETWSAAPGIKTSTLNEIQLTATISRSLTYDVRGVAFVKFTQGGISNDGTPTGTLAATYTLKGS